MNAKTSFFIISLFLGFSYLLVYFVFGPSLTGGFVFDDEIVLPPLSANGGVVDFPSAIAFLLSSDYPPGRPIALATFLLDDQYWPANPLGFKQTNLMFHLMAAWLVFYVTFLLSKLRYEAKEAILLATFVSLVWAVHPIVVSTVAYVSQRMTILSAIFVLAALVIFIKARQSLFERFSWGAFVGLFLAAAVGYLGVLAKENAFLICLFFPIVNSYMRANLKREVVESTSSLRAYRSFQILCVVIPLLLFFVYLIYSGVFTSSYVTRDFTPFERLLTQSRVIWLYLAEIIAPFFGGGFLGAEVEVSRSLIDPISTLFAIVSVVGLFWFVCFRMSWSLVKLGFLLFFAGHALESTILNLELYFDHRNYLPLVGILFALFGLVADAFVGARRAMLISIGAIFIAAYSPVTLDRSLMWGDSERYYGAWLEQSSDSLRPAMYKVNAYIENRKFYEAKLLLDETVSKYPDVLSPLLSTIIFECSVVRAIDPKIVKVALSVAKDTKYETKVFELVGALLNSGLIDRCAGITQSDVYSLVDQLLGNPKVAIPDSQMRIHLALAQHYQAQLVLDKTLEHYRLACKNKCTPAIAYNHVKVLLSARLCNEAVNRAATAVDELSLIDRLKYYKYKHALERISAIDCER